MTPGILCTAHFGVDLPFHGLELVSLELGDLLPLILEVFSPCNQPPKHVSFGSCRSPQEGHRLIVFFTWFILVDWNLRVARSSLLVWVRLRRCVELYPSVTQSA